MHSYYRGTPSILHLKVRLLIMVKSVVCLLQGALGDFIENEKITPDYVIKVISARVISGNVELNVFGASTA